MACRCFCRKSIDLTAAIYHFRPRHSSSLSNCRIQTATMSFNECVVISRAIVIQNCHLCFVTYTEKRTLTNEGFFYCSATQEKRDYKNYCRIKTFARPTP